MVAPMALRTPISRVRSVTETSMMFMTPTPPTSRPTLETANMKMTRPAVICAQKARMRIGAEDGEVVVLLDADATALAQQRPHLFGRRWICSSRRRT